MICGNIGGLSADAVVCLGLFSRVDHTNLRHLGLP